MLDMQMLVMKKMKKYIIYGMVTGLTLGLLVLTTALIRMYLKTSQYQTNHCYAELYRDISKSIDEAVSRDDLDEVKRISIALREAEFRYYQSCETSSKRYRQLLEPK